MLTGGTKLAALATSNLMSLCEYFVQPKSEVIHLRKPETQESPDNSAADELADLRRLMLGPILDQQAALEKEIESLKLRQSDLKQRSIDCSEVLAQSLNRIHGKGEHLNTELETEIFSGVQKSFEKEPERMAELMYPILGPAVRKLVASLFQRNQADPGKPYQVEQLFLIHKETSILLSQAMMNEDAARDADLVSGMLEAIRSFVSDAFSLHEFDGMNSINLGDLTVWVEWGPKAVLAVVIRGFPDDSLREYYADVLQQIHKDYASELTEFDGDDSGFQSLDIATLSQTQEKSGAIRSAIKTWFNFPRMCLAATVLLIFTIANTVSDNRQWDQMMLGLTTEPGVVVVNAQRSWGKDTLTILHDPLAASISTIISRAGIDTSRVALGWHSFQSQDAPIVQRRQLQRLLSNNSYQTPQTTNQLPTINTKALP